MTLAVLKLAVVLTASALSIGASPPAPAASPSAPKR